MSEPPFESSDPTESTGHPAAPPVSTGDDEVDAILAALQPLGGLPVAEHVAVYEHVHGELRAVLARPPGE